MARESVCIVGLGTMGAAIAASLAPDRFTVFGLEQHARGDRRGAGMAPTRTFRQAYSDPTLVELARRARQDWFELEEEFREQLFLRTGALLISQPTDPAYRALLESCRAHRLPHEELGEAALRDRFPALRPQPGEWGLFEQDAGLLLASTAIESCLHRAEQNGAELHFGEPVESIRPRGGSFLIETGIREFHADWVIVAAGAWFPGLTGNSPLPPAVQSVERQVQVWFDSAGESSLEPEQLPPFHYRSQDPGGTFYAAPSVHGSGVLGARHLGGEKSSRGQDDWSARAEEIADVQSGLKQILPAANHTVLDARVGQNAWSPTGDFVLGPADTHARLFAVGGFCGHGFKFMPTIGRLIARWLQDGSPDPLLTRFCPTSTTFIARGSSGGSEKTRAPTSR